MKSFKYSILIFLSIFVFFSCSKDDDNGSNNINEIENLQLVKTISDTNFKVEFFNDSGEFQVGYNKIYLRITDQNGDYVQDASINWMPMMTMDMGGTIHEHSTPFSEISKTEGKQTLYDGYIVFSMASDEPHSFWELEIDFSANGQSVEISKKIDVISTESEYHKTFTSVTGTDDVTYFLALVEPTNPVIGTNDMVVALFKMGEHHDFPIVDNYKIKIDPRMPGMGNHSAPGNVDLTQHADGFYHGKVGFSMTGYWKINMILENQSGEAVKGEPITETHPESSLNFKLEF